MTTKELKFTPTEQRILDLLEDGLPHSRKDVIACLNDEMATRLNLNPHLTHLRNKLRPLGQTIICELVKKAIFYRRVILYTES